jgi:hypothetical protein
MFGEGQLGWEMAEMLCNTEQSAACFGELISSVRLSVVTIGDGVDWSIIFGECFIGSAVMMF